jgi:hypothetical protein
MLDSNGICSKENAAFWECYRKERGTVGLNVPSSLAALFSIGDANKDKKQEK